MTPTWLLFIDIAGVHRWRWKKKDFLFNWWKPQCWLKAPIYIFFCRHLCTPAMFTNSSQVDVALFFYHFTFPGFPFIFIFIIFWLTKNSMSVKTSNHFPCGLLFVSFIQRPLHYFSRTDSLLFLFLYFCDNNKLEILQYWQILSFGILLIHVKNLFLLSFRNMSTTVDTSSLFIYCTER